MKRVILAIDPGSPKKKDISANTGYVIGDMFTNDIYRYGTIEIFSKNREIGEKACVEKLRSVYDEYVEMGYEVDVVVEEYLNYSKQGFGVRNATSELIGRMKQVFPNVSMQSTSQIKTMFGNNQLVEMEILKKESNKWTLVNDPGSGKFTRHTIDAIRHYMLRKHKLGI